MGKMMDEKIVSYVMSGGVGSRLWPLSREDFPKQFHDFSGKGSMLACTLARLHACPNKQKMPIYIIGQETHANHLHNETAGYPLHGGRIILEPIGRNTAAAVALATQITLQEYGNALILICPSDHEIASNDDFWTSIKVGIAPALAGRLVTFGITPDRPETGYGYIETGVNQNGISDGIRFIEKPDLATAAHYVKQGNFLWNSGIFLFSSQSMKNHFESHAPHIWHQTKTALAHATQDVTSIWLPFEHYQHIPADSVDYAIMERAKNVAVVPAHFSWNDLGSWQSLLDLQTIFHPHNKSGNVIVGDVVAIDCEGSYLRSQSGLLAAIGLKNMAVVKTTDSTFVAPVNKSQHVRQIVSELEKSGRLETKLTPSPDRSQTEISHIKRVHHWLFNEALPLWAKAGVDERGGFHECLDFNARPIRAPKRMRTMARQIYVFAMAHKIGWDGPAKQLLDHGIDFIATRGRSPRGGWITSFDAQGAILDEEEDLYDQAFVIFALAHAFQAGHKLAKPLLEESLHFLDHYLADKKSGGFYETPEKTRPFRRSNPHMHLLEAFLSCYQLTGEPQFLTRASQIVDLFCSHFFDATNWSLGEYFSQDWQLATNETGEICEPGHHFEWAWLLVFYTRLSGKTAFSSFARKLYAYALSFGINRTTGLCFNSISKFGAPLDLGTRSWQQGEIIKAAISLDGLHGLSLQPEIEERIRRLFHWHLNPAPKGLWIDAIDAQGKGISKDVPASILYHLVCALTHYLDHKAILI